MNGFLWIDGRPMPTPNRCPITQYDMDSAKSGRAENGYMHRDRIRSGMFSMQPSWVHLTAAQAEALENALAPAAFHVQFRLAGKTRTKRMYAGDRQWEPDFHEGEEFWNLTVQLIEC